MPQNPDPIRPWNLCYCCLVAKLCPALLGPIDCSPPGSSIHGISEARILEWVAISFPRGTSQSRVQAHITCVSSTGRWVLYHWATYEALGIYTWQKTKDPGDVMEYMKKILFQDRDLREEERQAGVYHWVCSCSPGERRKEDPHGCEKSEATAEQSTQVLRESLQMISSKEVRGNDMGSRCEMSAEMSLMLFPIFFSAAWRVWGPRCPCLLWDYQAEAQLWS